MTKTNLPLYSKAGTDKFWRWCPL